MLGAPSYEKLGLFLKFERIKRRWTRQEVSDQVTDPTITTNVLRHWEDGKVPIPFRSMVALCNLYEIPIQDLLIEKQ